MSKQTQQSPAATELSLCDTAPIVPKFVRWGSTDKIAPHEVTDHPSLFSPRRTNRTIALANAACFAGKSAQALIPRAPTAIRRVFYRQEYVRVTFLLVVVPPDRAVLATCSYMPPRTILLPKILLFSRCLGTCCAVFNRRMG